MKTLCCACGKTIRMSMLLGQEGHELQGKAYACYDCCKRIGYGKGVIGAMGLALYTREQFVAEYRAAIERENLSKQEQLEAKRRIQESRQAKINTVKNLIDGFSFKTEKVSNADTETKYDESNLVENLSDEDLIVRMNQFVVDDPGLILSDGEKCFYQGICYSVRLKNVVTGTSGNSVHIGGKNSLGIYLGSGTSQRNYERSTVAEKYPGDFYITNKRMVCNALKLAFEVELNKITSLATYSDALVITVKDKTYIVGTEEIDIIKELLAVNNEGMKRGLGKMGSVSQNEGVTSPEEMGEDEIIQILRKYKALYDEGIITEEEFLNKKKQLLG